MKKTFFIIGIILILLAIVFLIWGTKSSPSREITPQEAVSLVKSNFNDKTLKTITNLENPEIEEIVFDSAPSIFYYNKDFNICNRPIYKITFKTTMDGLLGPIVTYVDKATGVLVGADFRE